MSLKEKIRSSTFANSHFSFLHFDSSMTWNDLLDYLMNAMNSGISHFQLALLQTIW